MVATVTMNRPSTAAAALLGALAATFAAGSAAHAADYPVDVRFDDPTSLTIEYGQPWAFPFTTGYLPDSGPANQYFEVRTTGSSTTYTPSLFINNDHSGSGSTFQGRIYPSWDSQPLAAGSYSFTVILDLSTGTADTIGGETPTPARLVVSPAKLGIEATVVADSSNPTGAIVSARFSGRFIEDYQSSYNEGAALSPAGAWHIVLTDEEGDVAVEKTVERSAGDDNLATSFYWADGKADEKYTAVVEFVPTGVSADNFTIEAAEPVTYVAQPDARPTPSSSATATPEEVPEPVGFALPLWTVLLDVLLIVALATLVTILAVRLRKRPAATVATMDTTETVQK